METAIRITDVHGNLRAFEAVLAYLRALQADLWSRARFGLRRGNPAGFVRQVARWGGGARSERNYG